MERIDNPMASKSQHDDPQAHIVTPREKAIHQGVLKIKLLKHELEELLELAKTMEYLDFDIISDIKTTYQQKILLTKAELDELIEAQIGVRTGFPPQFRAVE